MGGKPDRELLYFAERGIHRMDYASHINIDQKKTKQTNEVLAHLLMAGLARRIDTDGGRHVLTVARTGRVKVSCYAR